MCKLVNGRKLWQGTGLQGTRPGAHCAEDRKPQGYWADYNQWWRDFLASFNERPGKGHIEAWYAEHAEAVWPDAMSRPTLQETIAHNKNCRTKDSSRDYARERRARLRQQAAYTGGLRSGSTKEGADEDSGLEKHDDSGCMVQDSSKRQLRSLQRHLSVPPFPLAPAVGLPVLQPAWPCTLGCTGLQPMTEFHPVPAAGLQSQLSVGPCLPVPWELHSPLAALDKLRPTQAEDANETRPSSAPAKRSRCTSSPSGCTDNDSDCSPPPPARQREPGPSATSCSMPRRLSSSSHSPAVLYSCLSEPGTQEAAAAWHMELGRQEGSWGSVSGHRYREHSSNSGGSAQDSLADVPNTQEPTKGNWACLQRSAQLKKGSALLAAAAAAAAEQGNMQCTEGHFPGKDRPRSSPSPSPLLSCSNDPEGHHLEAHAAALPFMEVGPPSPVIAPPQLTAPTLVDCAPAAPLGMPWKRPTSLQPLSPFPAVPLERLQSTGSSYVAYAMPCEDGIGSSALHVPLLPDSKLQDSYQPATRHADKRHSAGVYNLPACIPGWDVHGQQAPQQQAALLHQQKQKLLQLQLMERALQLQQQQQVLLMLATACGAQIPAEGMELGGMELRRAAAGAQHSPHSQVSGQVVQRPQRGRALGASVSAPDTQWY
ncbi:hypothetical protein V8C86DRAFT_1245508 [Haematococcus lacustris]